MILVKYFKCFKNSLNMSDNFHSTVKLQRTAFPLVILLFMVIEARAPMHCLHSTWLESSKENLIR